MGNSQVWPLKVQIDLVGEPASRGFIEIRPGITTLVGPNGTGKTRALRSIKAALKDAGGIEKGSRKIHLLAAGRSSPMEHFRSATQNPGYIDPAKAAVGHVNFVANWWDLESVTGVLLALSSRADLRLKVEARLQQLFDRSVHLSWEQNGLVVQISSLKGGPSYTANNEASGILQLVALLAAIHNDSICALIIDEPEISLHPQHQAFLLEEMEKVAGDPSDPARKLIVIATHSSAFLPLRTVRDLPSIGFFNSARHTPAQVQADAPILNRTKLTGMVARLSTTHRMAMFAERVLLVEGPSDEIIATQLARRLNQRLLARNTQILPVTGKGEFIEVAKLFRLMNKQVAVLADLDALADDNGLVRHFSELPEAISVAESLARKSIVDLDGDLRVDLTSFMTKHADMVNAAIATYPDWSSKESSSLAPRRVTLARVLTEPQSFGVEAVSEAESLCTRYKILLAALEKLGCFFLRRGAIENYYQPSTEASAKPERAAAESADFIARSPEDLNRDYRDVLAAIAHIAPNQCVDDDRLLRPKLGAALTAAFLGMNIESTDEELNALTRSTIGSDADVFHLSNRSNKETGLLRIEVHMISQLFNRSTFPFEIGHDENPSVVVRAKLPGTA